MHMATTSWALGKLGKMTLQMMTTASWALWNFRQMTWSLDADDEQSHFKQDSGSHDWKMKANWVECMLPLPLCLAWLVSCAVARRVVRFGLFIDAYFQHFRKLLHAMMTNFCKHSTLDGNRVCRFCGLHLFAMTSDAFRKLGCSPLRRHSLQQAKCKTCAQWVERLLGY